MKKILLSALLLCGAASAFAQCDKKLLLTSSKTEYLDGSGNLQREDDENTILEIYRDSLTIAPGNAPAPMTGVITEQTCNWSVPFKEGKSVIKARVADGNGETRNMTLTIEGKGGKVTLLAVLDEMPDMQIRVALDKFSEKS